MRAKKRLGQNFLHDVGIIDRIIQIINPKSSQSIIEIGPGTGALTEHLAACGAPLQLIEFDRDLIPVLNNRFADNPHVTIHHQDALTLELNQGPYLIVGNLPYNISSPLLIRLLQQADYIERGVFMLQKELVQRICAEPGSKTFGRLSVMLQHRFACYAALTVPPEAFKPIPKVDSQIIELIPHKEFTEVPFAALEFVVKQAFAQRRKTIRNNLKKWFSDNDLLAVGIQPSQRAETVAVNQFEQLALQYHASH